MPNREYRQLFAFKHSQDHGNRWRTVVICGECKLTVEPPDLLKPMGEASSRSCEWCGCGHIADKPPEPTKESKEFASTFTKALSNWAKEQGVQDPFEDEDLPPNECCDLDVAFSPVIPFPHGKLDDAVEVEKLSNSLYRYTDMHGLHTVSAEELKTMRIRYIMTTNKLQAAYMVTHNPPDHIFHKLGKSLVGEDPSELMEEVIRLDGAARCGGRPRRLR